MTGVAASRTGNPFWGIHRKGGSAHDSLRDYFNLHRDIGFIDVLWQLDCSDYRLSR